MKLIEETMKTNVQLLNDFAQVAKEIRMNLFYESEKIKLEKNILKLIDVLEEYEINYGEKPKKKKT